ncbi:MAG TPA: hypothetical protein DCR24_12375 [Bacillus bacterium]|nr:hypothetical protein [Bacillus sp. (in: firmicutes)]
MKSFFDFSWRSETGMYSRLFRNGETGDSDKEALYASDGGVEVSEFLEGETGPVVEELGAADRQERRRRLVFPYRGLKNFQKM